MPQIVYIPGVWDLLHVGHVRILKTAKKLGNQLIVGIPSDGIVLQDKGELPVIPLHERMELLQSLACVDIVSPYFALEFLSDLKVYEPDVLAVGSTWGNEQRHWEAESWVQLNKKKFVKIPYTEGISTTAIKERIRCQEPSPKP